MTSPNPDSRPTLKEVANVLGGTPPSPVLGDGVAGAVAPASKGAPLPAVVHGLSDLGAPTSMRVPAWLWSDFHYPVSSRPLAAMINTVDESLSANTSLLINETAALLRGSLGDVSYTYTCTYRPLHARSLCCSHCNSRILSATTLQLRHHYAIVDPLLVAHGNKTRRNATQRNLCNCPRVTKIRRSQHRTPPPAASCCG